MRRVFFSLIAALSLLVACDNGDNNLPNKPDEKSCYEGVMTVDQNDGTIFTQDAVEVDYEITADGKLNFKMYKVKFASGMPLKLDMAVEGVDFVENNGAMILSGDGIVPYAMGGPFEKYTITELVGEITEHQMTLDFMCGEYPVTYDGVK